MGAIMTSLLLNTSRWALLAGVICCVGTTSAAAQPPGAPGAGMPVRPPDPQPVTLVMENQFEKKTDLADLRGAVVILVYGDRKGTDACRALGEQLHVYWHPDAKGMAPGPAQRAGVAPLPGLAATATHPDVRVIPVACCGKVPAPVKFAIRGQIAKGSPDVPVWLDFADTMKTSYGLTSGEPNLVIFDAAGRLRMKVNGAPDQPTLDRVVKAVQNLRIEAVK